jgi:hypothetical protein
LKYFLPGLRICGKSFRCMFANGRPRKVAGRLEVMPTASSWQQMDVVWQDLRA